MCGRYAFYAPQEAVRRLFGLAEAPLLEPRYNIAPTQCAPVIRVRPDGERRLGMLHWGLVPHWARDRRIGNRMINARAESVAVKPSFRQAFRRRRCLIPASGFYEWRALASGKQPYYISSADGGPLVFAGLWERWRGQAEEPALDSFTIITTAANERLAELHDRMPVILAPEDHERWLQPAQDAPGELTSLLRPCPEEWLEARPVSRRVNDPRHEGPELVETSPPQ